MAAAVMRHLVATAGLTDRIAVDSAGIGGWHRGEPADPRTHDTLRRHGYPLDTDPARQWSPADFASRELVVAMDRGHQRDLTRMAPDGAARERVRLLRSFGVPDGAAQPTGRQLDVPDPYFGGRAEFDEVFDLVEAGCRAILSDIADTLPIR